MIMKFNRKLVLAAVLLGGLNIFTCSQDAKEESELLFRAGFDKGPDADFSKGFPVATVPKDFSVTKGAQGKNGEAAAVTKYLIYMGKNNFNPRKGTILMWIKSDKEIPGGILININSGKHGQFIFFIYGDGRLFLRCYNEKGKMCNFGSKYKISDWKNQWHEVGFAYDIDKETVKLLIDGKVDNSGKLTGMPDLTDKIFRIGIGYYMNNGKNQFAGLIDDVRIYSAYTVNDENKTGE